MTPLWGVCNKTAYPQLSRKLIFHTDDELIVPDLRLTCTDARIIYKITQLY